MKNFVVVILVIFLAGVSANVIANSGPVEVVFKASNGTVTYLHAQHTKYGAQCQSCHHQGVLSGTCRRCHDGKGDAPVFKEAAHKVCKECHEQKGGPVACKGCHVK